MSAVRANLLIGSGVIFFAHGSSRSGETYCLSERRGELQRLVLFSHRFGNG